MPRKITAYACKFKCGSKVLTKKQSMLDHETRCFYNPANRACASCANHEREHDSDDYRAWVNDICHAQDKVLENLTSNCDMWRGK